MKAREALVVCFIVSAVSVGVALEPVTVRSHSGQFLVRGLPLGVALFSGNSTSAVAYLRLDPALLAVSCERIKESLLDELRMKDHWRGKVYLALHPVREDNEPITVTSVHYTDGWGYRVNLPEQVNKKRLIKAMVQVLLLEMAGRKADSFQPELPPWLVEGMAAHLQSARLSNWALEPDMRIARSERNPDPLGRARECLRSHPSLTLNELNWPTEEQLADDDVIYQSCAQLFVYELLRLRKGAECLDEMLAGLPQHLNWQTAFLQAFNGHFQRLIDVDKWWALNVIHFVGRDLRSSWPTRASWDRLEEILSTPVQVRLDPKELPIPSQVKLQHVITEWDYPRQTPVLMLKLNHLQALRLRTSPDLAGLVEDYRQVIESYLRRQNQAGASRNHKLQPENHGIVADTLKRLDALDAHREMLRKSTNAPPGAELTITP